MEECQEHSPLLLVLSAKDQVLVTRQCLGAQQVLSVLLPSLLHILARELLWQPEIPEAKQPPSLTPVELSISTTTDSSLPQVVLLLPAPREPTGMAALVPLSSMEAGVPGVVGVHVVSPAEAEHKPALAVVQTLLRQTEDQPVPVHQLNLKHVTHNPVRLTEYAQPLITTVP